MRRQLDVIYLHMLKMHDPGSITCLDCSEKANRTCEEKLTKRIFDPIYKPFAKENVEFFIAQAIIACIAIGV